MLPIFEFDKYRTAVAGGGGASERSMSTASNASRMSTSTTTTIGGGMAVGGMVEGGGVRRRVTKSNTAAASGAQQQQRPITYTKIVNADSGDERSEKSDNGRSDNGGGDEQQEKKTASSSYSPNFAREVPLISFLLNASKPFPSATINSYSFWTKVRHNSMCYFVESKTNTLQKMLFKNVYLNLTSGEEAEVLKKMDKPEVVTFVNARLIIVFGRDFNSMRAVKKYSISEIKDLKTIL